MSAGARSATLADMGHVQRLVVDGLGRLPQFTHAGLTDDLVFVSGTLGTGEGFSLAPGGIGPETTQALHNVERILAAAGSTWADVVKVSVFVADMADFAAMNEAYAAFFGDLPPARITVGGVQLALGARVEVECVARRGFGQAAGTAAIRRRTGFVDHDGERLYYELSGPDDGVPLVLCHGAGGSHAVWFQQVASFAVDRPVLTWDHRGYGRSTDNGGRSGPDVATGDLLAILDAHGFDRVDLVGQSMGGWTVAGAALARPALARSVVLADSLAGFTSPEIDAILAGRWAGAQPANDILGAHPALDPEFSTRQPELAHLYQSLGRMGSADPAVILPRLAQSRRAPADAAGLTVPVLCIVGDRDPLFPPAAVRALAGMLPDARVVEISGCGHSPYYEDPHMWNAVVSHFLGEVARSRR